MSDEDLLKEIFEESGVEFHDVRLSYVVIQITTSTWNLLQKRFGGEVLP